MPLIKDWKFWATILVPSAIAVLVAIGAFEPVHDALQSAGGSRAVLASVALFIQPLAWPVAVGATVFLLVRRQIRQEAQARVAALAKLDPQNLTTREDFAKLKEDVRAWISSALSDVEKKIDANFDAHGKSIAAVQRHVDNLLPMISEANREARAGRADLNLLLEDALRRPAAFLRLLKLAAQVDSVINFWVIEEGDKEAVMLGLRLGMLEEHEDDLGHMLWRVKLRKE
jgi:hypothetical protein